jgi:hypothetical protein
MATEQSFEGIYDTLKLRTTKVIRVVDLQPASEDHHDVICDLRVVSLDDGPEYEALSYTWGPPFEDQSLQREQILLAGSETRVTGNLFCALKRLRFSDKPRVLWVDAICINQDDISERSQQVAMMSQIYAGARRVLVWLGEDSELNDGRVSLEIIQHLASTSEAGLVMAIVQIRMSGASGQDHFYSVMAQLLSTSSILSQLQVPNNSASVVSANVQTQGQIRKAMRLIRHFFSRRYFRRLWVVQEMYHAKNGKLYCGKQHIYWQTFLRGFDRLRKAGTSLLLEDYHGKALLENMDATLVERIPRMLKLKKNAAHFLKCLELTHGTSCQDPRDQIFALSSMNDEDWPQPDYSLSVGQVYVNFTRSCIEHGCCEAILHQASLQLARTTLRQNREAIMPGCPSWAVNWQDIISIAAFWHDNERNENNSPDGSFDDQGRLWCTFAVLANVENDNTSNTPQLSFPGIHSIEDIKSRIEPCLELAMLEIVCGDVLCRVSTAPAEEYVEGVWKKTPAEDKLLVLRPTPADRSMFTIAPISSPSINHARLELRSLPPEGVRRRICLV